ncbi:MAG: putative signal transduction histidine kinase [Ramlibacter sp.]|nr:putative signal transduction histidine kinase [Ramlibacter sp.]
MSPTRPPGPVFAQPNEAAHAERRLPSALDDCESLARLVQLYDVLRVSCDGLESDGLDRFLETIVGHAVEIAGATAGWLALPSADETQIEIVGSCKRDIQPGGLFPVQAARRVIPLTGYAREAWDAVRNAGDLHWQRFDERRIPATMQDWCEGRGDGEALLAPVRLGGTAFGHLGLAFGAQGRPSETRLHVARLLAQQTGVAIRIQRLGDSAREAASQSAIEAERARLAGEIHDGVAQAFLAVIMQARIARLGDPPREQRLLNSLAQIESLAVVGLEEARRSVFALRSISVETGGLISALERLVGSLSFPGRTQFLLVNRAGAPGISPAVEDAVYRIAQEATQNALKHAGASEVTIQLDEDNGRLRMRIEDDGEGVADDVFQGARERGGLRAMRERAERCGGSLVVGPRAPRGTRVDVLLPMRAPPA